MAKTMWDGPRRTWRESAREIIETEVKRLANEQPDLTGEKLRRVVGRANPWGPGYASKAWSLAMQDVFGMSEKAKAAQKEKLARILAKSGYEPPAPLPGLEGHG